MVKELPIPFSTPMVQAILDGRKTQTRRIVAKQPDDGGIIRSAGDSRFIIEHWPKQERQMLNYGRCEEINPKWKPGDILWVRENWQIHSWDFEDGTINVKYSNGDIVECVMRDDFDNSPFTAEWLQFQLDSMAEKGIFQIVDKYDNPTLEDDEIFYKRTGKPQPFKPSIHMPKEASRIWLQVEEIRVERLQDISEEDAAAEGVEPIGYDNKRHRPFRYKNYPIDKGYQFGAIQSFKSLWEWLYGTESWNSNLFVWVIKFKVLSTTGRPEELNHS